MKDIPKLASLSKIYTNHNDRAIAITMWSDAHVPHGGDLRPPLRSKPQKLQLRLLYKLVHLNSPS